jgi:predicted small lipoprotein YifL
MNIRALVPLALLSSVLVLSACGNKGPLLPPPAPDDDEWPAEPAEDVDDQDDASDVDDTDPDEVEAGVDGEGDDPPADDSDDEAGDDGDGDA